MRFAVRGGGVWCGGLVGREEKGALPEYLISKWRREDGRGRGGKTQIRGGKPGEIWAVGFASSTPAAAARAGLRFTKVRDV